MEQKICVIAHDTMKPRLIAFMKERAEWLWGRKLIATGQTAALLKKEELKVEIEAVKRGRNGGFKELTEKVNHGEISLVIFFRDPEIDHEQEVDIIQLTKACIKRNIPLASNPASAELLIVGLIRMEAAKK